MTWTLPPLADPSAPVTPICCDERPSFLSSPPPDRPQFADNGGALCDVRQIPAPFDIEGKAQLAEGEGFYYGHVLGFDEGSWFGLTELASPPPYINIEFRCNSQMPREAAPTVEEEPRRTWNQPAPAPEPRAGDLCDGQWRARTAAYAVPTERGIRGDAWCHADTSPEPLFCHRQENICVRACQTDQDCRPGWICDTDITPLSQTAGQAICINPAC